MEEGEILAGYSVLAQHSETGKLAGGHFADFKHAIALAAELIR